MYYLQLLIMVPSVLTNSILKDLRNVEDGRIDSDNISDIIMKMGNISEDPDTNGRMADKTSEVITNDDVYILSKLSDDELLKLLSKQSDKNVNPSSFLNDNEVPNKKRPETTANNAKKNDALFRLENEVLNPQLQNNEEYKAWQKLNNLLTDLPKDLQDKGDQSIEEEERKILFDILVGQLKSLSFKKKSISSKVKTIVPTQHLKPNQQNDEEFMFLILSEDINENSNELVTWNPKILEKNCSVVVLGPIAKPFPSNQLSKIMDRVTKELSKPEYLSVLEQLSKGIIEGKPRQNMVLLSSQTRRYMKPHRCNHRSQLARIYGGPKWLLCTGYLNLNTPSLYD